MKIYRYVTENTLDSYMWQILENKQKFISQIMTSKSPVRACDDVDDTALSYAEIKALATGNPYIKEKMDLDIQVSKLKLLKANHTSQIYSLESDIARRYPREIAVAQGQIEALKTDMEAAKPLLVQDKDHFSMEISGKVYTERKEAGAAIIEACKALKAAGTEGRIGSYGAFELHSRFDNFDKVFRLSIKGAWNYSMEVGKDPQGNILLFQGFQSAFHLRQCSFDARQCIGNTQNVALRVFADFHRVVPCALDGQAEHLIEIVKPGTQGSGCGHHRGL